MSEDMRLAEEEALALLRTCRVLLHRIDESGMGIYYRPIAEDRPVVDGFMRLANAYRGPAHELAFDELRRRAGLSLSGWALVRGMVEQYTFSLPGVAEHRIAMLARWLEREDG